MTTTPTAARTALPRLGTLADLRTLVAIPEAFADWLIERFGDDAVESIGLRGLWAADVQRGRLIDSSVWVDGAPTRRRVAGTSAVGIAADYPDASYAEIVAAIRQYAAQAIGYGGTGVVALVVGDRVDLRDDEDRDIDPGEIVIRQARIDGVWSDHA